ncbi:membrane protein [Nibrella viscosa]|uniref:Membrane protein n=1 Tax=Nibrella viscosa TaxID=1084524 RepID=A0ABP8KDR0_9BACT
MSLLAMSLAAPAAMAQGFGNSPYSALGIGEVLGQANVTNLGMGGIGVSYASPFYLNSQNPALLARRSRFTIFEVGLLGQSKQLSQRVLDSQQSQRDFGANLSYLALAFPASSRWNMSLSLRPYSYIDYQTRQYGRIPGTIYEAEYTYSGRGAINKASFSNGVRLWKNIFLGAEMSYLFGNVTNNSDSQVLINSSTDVQVTRIDRVNYSDLVWRLGAAWRPKLSENWTLNVGATVDPGTKVRARETDIYQQVLNGQSLSAPDTLRINQAGSVTMPRQLQFGVSIERNNQLIVGVDVGLNPLSQFRTISDQPGNLRDALHIAAGIEFTPKSNSTRYWDLVSYRAGFQYNKTPYAVDGRQLNDINGSLGISLPVGAYLVNHVNLALVGGQRGALTGTQIRERYVRISLGLSLNDLWFRKVVID